MYSSFSNDYIDHIEKYTNQVEKAKTRLTPEEYKQYSSGVKMRQNVALLLKESVKFKLPDDGALIDTSEPPLDVMKRFMDEVNLPYQGIAVEFTSNFYDGNGRPTILIAYQSDDIIMMHCLYWKESNNNWFTMEAHDEDGSFLMGHSINRYTFERQFYGNFDESTNTELGGLFTACLQALAHLLCALTCSNIVIADDENKPSKVKAQMRRDKKKLPFFEFKTLIIDSKRTNTKTDRISGEGAEYTARRMHLRRGHIRRLEHKSVWVNACVVGDKSKGSIEKEYVVKK